MTVAEQLNLGKQIFDEILGLSSGYRYTEAMAFIESATPPDEWVIELDSSIKAGSKYSTMKWELMEAVMKRIFKSTHIHSISSPIINQIKSDKFSVTINTQYAYLHLNGEAWCYLPGIATEVVSDITQLQIAVPRAATLANKNAVKNLGGLFGKHLNKDVEVEEPIPSYQEPSISPEEKEKNLIESIGFAKNITDLKSYRILAYAKGSSPAVQDLYETKFRELSNKF